MITLNEQPINVTKFPDGTSQVWKLPDDLSQAPIFFIKWEFQNESEIFHLLQLVTLLRHCCPSAWLELQIPFLPYGRQDKAIDNATTWALRPFAELINSMRFDLVVTVDAHSSVARELINKLENIYPKKEIDLAITAIRPMEEDCERSFAVCYPDKGAAERYMHSPGQIVGNKVRDPSTGRITSYCFDGDPSGKDILIVDDICDGGATFKLLAEGLLEKGANSVCLYVTHGIFSKGIQTLKDSGISRIFTRTGEVTSKV